MKILVTGSSGLIGTTLVTCLEEKDHEVIRLIRTASGNATDTAFWNPESGVLDPKFFSGCDAVIHLAGENIAEGRWTAEKKRRLRKSRIEGTTLLCKTIAGLDNPPSILLSASAVGYYGNTLAQPRNESGDNGKTFLARLCREWEESTRTAEERGLRVVHMRFGVILDAHRGALAKMLPAFKLGLAGKFGQGNQYISWITSKDAVRAIEHALTCGDLSGPVNFTTPNPVTNLEFTKTLARALHRPAVLPVPAFLARLAIGEMASELLLIGTPAIPRKLLESGFQFQHPDLSGALRSILA